MFKPVQYRFFGKKILVIGGGNTAYAYTQKLLGYEATVKVIAKAFNHNFTKLEKLPMEKVVLKHTELDTSYFEGVQVVVIATSNNYLNKAIYKHCHDHNILVITKDKSLPSDLILMESAESDNLILSASTYGLDHGIELEIVNELINDLHEDYFKRLEMIKRQQRMIKGLGN